MNNNFKELIISTYDSQYDINKISDLKKLLKDESKGNFHEMVFCMLAAGTSAGLLKLQVKF